MLKKSALGDLTTPHDTARGLRKDELEKGKKVEKEHTDDVATAKQIAIDHLREIPDYYTRLIKMEKSAAFFFMAQKVAAAFGLPKVPKPGAPRINAPSKPSIGVGRFDGVATNNSLKPPGPAASAQAVNPRKSVTNAMNAFRG